MELLIVSFVGGVLTVLAPCILPVLPIVIGGAARDERDVTKPFVIIASLMASIVLFTLLLKASTSLLGIPPYIWQFISGGIIILFGVTLVFPGLWERIIGPGLNATSNKWLYSASGRKGVGGDILIGAALGPVFSSCSPTYALILATVLPASFALGVTYLIAYAAGLGAVLLLIALLGQKIVTWLKPASNPRGWFKRSLGILFMIVGLAVLFGFDKDFQVFVLDKGLYDPVAELERSVSD